MDEITHTTGTNLGPVTAGQRYRQGFVAREDNLTGISILAATYGQKVRSTAAITVEGEDGAVLRRVELNTETFSDNAWQCFPFDPIPGSRGRAYWFSLETDSTNPGEAITVWTNNGGAAECLRDGDGTGAAMCFKGHYAPNTVELLDPLVSNHLSASGPSGVVREKLDQIVFQCIKKELFFARLVHLLNAFNMTEGVKNVLSIGCGQGYHEAYLAGRFPHLRVDGIDLRVGAPDFGLPNLRFLECDVFDSDRLGEFDFVFSIECLEHIKEDRAAFRHMAARVKPGGYFYVAVPFASRQEQEDQAYRKYCWDNFEHFTPGYTFDDLRQFFEENGLEVLHAANQYHTNYVPALDELMSRMDAPTIRVALESIVRLYALDVDDTRLDGRTGALAVRFLARRRGPRPLPS
jgi:SAM-dependent methyltransferase